MKKKLIGSCCSAVLLFFLFIYLPCVSFKPGFIAFVNLHLEATTRSSSQVFNPLNRCECWNLLNPVAVKMFLFLFIWRKLLISSWPNWVQIVNFASWRFAMSKSLFSWASAVSSDDFLLLSLKVESAKNYSLKFVLSLPLQLVLETADLLYDLFWVLIALVSNSDSSLTQSWPVLFSNIPFFREH